MVYILVRHKVRDYEKFRKVFFGNFKKVKNNGSQHSYIFRNKNDLNEVWVLVKWKSLESFKKFSESPKIPKDSQKLGTVIGTPEGWFFENVEEFSGKEARFLE